MVKMVIGFVFKFHYHETAAAVKVCCAMFCRLSISFHDDDTIHHPHCGNIRIKELSVTGRGEMSSDWMCFGLFEFCDQNRAEMSPFEENITIRYEFMSLIRGSLS